MSFNPRARDGREHGHDALLYLQTVSIHAPVMDANLVTGTVPATSCFNPRARDGREVVDLLW